MLCFVVERLLVCCRCLGYGIALWLVNSVDFILYLFGLVFGGCALCLLVLLCCDYACGFGFVVLLVVDFDWHGVCVLAACLVLG